MPAVPADSKAYNHSVYFIIMLQGFGLLLPWNVTLNAVPYFSDLYSKDTPIATYLTSAYIYPQLPMLFLITFYGHRISFTARIVASLAVQIVLLAAMPLLAPHSMWLTLGIFFVIGLSTAVLQSSVFGFSSFFPPIFNQGLMVGQGLSGVLACIANVMVLLLLPDAKTLSAAVYFGVSAASLGACLVSYLYLLQMSFAQFYIERATKAANRDHEAAATSALDNDGALLAGDDAAAASDGHAGGDDSPPRATLRKVFPSVALMASSVFLVFVVTFVVFPGIAPFEIAFKNSLGSLSLSDKWWQLTLLTVFNVFDTAGRMAPALGQLCKGYSLFVSAGVAHLY